MEIGKEIEFDMKNIDKLSPVAAGTRRPRAQSLQLGDRDCCSSGSFVSKLYRMVDSEPSSIVSWIRGGSAFCIVDAKLMAEHCLPKYFRHRRFSSLIRQLNFYSFYRVQEGQLTIYQHSFFRKGRPDLLSHIKRRGAGKAKDPWFDPLASAPKPHTAGPHGHMDTAMPTFSPMSKSYAIDNISPAMKPGVAQVTPPVVALATMDTVDAKSYHPSQAKENDLKYAMTVTSMDNNHSVYYEEEQPQMDTRTNAPMKPMFPTSNAAFDSIDIQDFLTEDCTIDAGVAEPQNQSDDHHSTMQHLTAHMLPIKSKCASVARNCLKWDEDTHQLDPRTSVSGGAYNATILNHEESSSTFEDELLRDLATVEPETWEVPLSPLNEGEDMMPWLDLCF